MSRSPTNVVDAARSEEYRKSWVALMTLVERGGSFSGYERPCAFLYTGSDDEARFANVSSVSGLDLLDDGRAIGVIDWDHDGDLDLWIANRTAPRLRLLRNDGTSSSRFVSAELRGTKSNRDAIGARVELHLAGETIPLLRTVRAGSGFLSQSSSAVHFGLGKSTPERIVVRWPNGTVEEFPGVRPGTRYQLVEGSGEANTVPVRSPQQLTAESLNVERRDETARVALPLRIPKTGLLYRGRDGSSKSRTQSNKRPLLLTLWASWCVPCQRELRELADHADALKAKGLDILALGVDDLTGGSTSEPARQLAEEFSKSFSVGFATKQLLEELELIFSAHYRDQRRFPVPMSFLLDDDGWITVVYRGRVAVPTLEKDLEVLRRKPAEYLARTLPFPGRWQRPPLAPSAAAGSASWAATALELAGYPAAARMQLISYTKYLEVVPLPKDASTAAAWKADLSRILTDSTAKTCALAREPGLAIGALGAALELTPNSDSTRVRYGGLLEQTGKPNRAILEYRKITDRDEIGIAAATRAALLCAAHPDESVRNAELALERGRHARRLSQDRDPLALDAHAAALAEAGRFNEAIDTASRAVNLAEQSGSAALARQIAQRRSLYQQHRPYRLALTR